ncbi:hypothetical protein DFH09DRAFT_1157617 [Mycena vulgaris]|nr:hypothetical protein DFH09DRAFT_1157617 [Mycena vulgaris]
MGSDRWGIQRRIWNHEGRSGVLRSFGEPAWEVRRVGRMNRTRGTAQASVRPMRFHELLISASLCVAVALRFVFEQVPVPEGHAFLYFARDVRALLELFLLRGCHRLDRRREKRRRNENVSVPRHALPGHRSFALQFLLSATRTASASSIGTVKGSVY